MFSAIIKNLSIRKLFLFFLSFLLLYKWKSLIAIADNQLRLIRYYLFSSFHSKENITHIYSYDINLDYVSWIDLIQYFNHFFTFLLIINIVILIYTKNKFFYSPFSKITLELIKGNLIYFFLFILVISLMVKDYIYMYSNLWNFKFLINVFHTDLVWSSILESFHTRFFLLLFYKVLIFYITFFSKDEKLIFRFIFWLSLSYLLRSTELLSYLIFDASIYYCVTHPTSGSFAKLNGGWFLYLESFFCYCSPEEKDLSKKISTNSVPVEVSSKEKRCEAFLHAAIECGLLKYSFFEQANLYFNPNTEPLLKFSKTMNSGECIEKIAKQYENCLKNSDHTASTTKEISSKNSILKPSYYQISKTSFFEDIVKENLKKKPE